MFVIGIEYTITMFEFTDRGHELVDHFGWVAHDISGTLVKFVSKDGDEWILNTTSFAFVAAIPSPAEDEEADSKTLDGEPAPIETTLTMIQRHIKEGAERIFRQKLLIANLSRHGHEQILSSAKNILEKMQILQDQLEERLALEISENEES
jgi:hypothetical protein